MINFFGRYISRRIAISSFRNILYDEISMMLEDAYSELRDSNPQEGLERMHDAALLYSCLPPNLHL